MRGDEIKKKIEGVLKNQSIDSEFRNRKNIDELLNEVSVYHRDLEYQNAELKRISSDLENTNRHYAELYSNAPVGLVLYYSNGVIKSANNAFALLVGVSSIDLVGTTIANIISAKYREAFHCHIKELKLGEGAGSHRVELTLLNGKRDVRVDSNLVGLGEPTLIQSAFTNTSNEVNLQATLNERIKELNCLLDITNICTQQNLHFSEILQQVVNRIPPAFQWPERVFAQISFNNRIYQSDNFKVATCHFRQSILVSSNEKGELTVYSDFVSQNPEDTFLGEEKKLLTAISLEVAKTIEYHRANSLLFKSEAYYRTLLHGLHEDIVVIDSNYTIIDVNNSYLKQSGLNRENIIGKSCFEILHRINVPCHLRGEQCELLTVFKTGKPSTCLHEHFKNDGSSTYVDIILSPLKDDLGKVLHVIEAARDITPIIMSQKAIKESEEKYRLLITQMQQGMALHEVVEDSNGKVIDYRFLEINDSFEKVTGLKRKNLIGKTVLEILPNTETYWIERYGKVATGGIPEHFENYSQELDRYFHVGSYSPKPGQFAVIITDITDRKKAEQILKQSEERYRSLFENNHAVMLVVDPSNGSIVDANPAAVWFYGWSKKEFKGMNIGAINTLTPDEINAEMKLAETESRKHFHFKHRLKNGQIRNVEVFSGPVEVNGKTLLYSFIHDVTEKVLAEEALKINEAKYRRLTESTKAIFREFDLINNRWTYISPQVGEFFGYSQKQWVNFDSWVQRIYVDDRERVVNLCKKSIEQGKNHVMEYRFVKADGQIIWLRDEVMVYKKEGGTYWLRGVMIDISERKNAETALEASEQKFKALFNSLTVGVTLLSPNLEVLQINPKIEEWFPDGNFSNKPFCYCAFSKGELKSPCPDCPVVNALKDGLNHEAERRIVNFKGKEKVYRIVATAITNEQGEIVAAVEMMDDITDRKNTENALLESEGKYRTLFESMEQGVVFHDSEGRVLSANNAAQRILGLTIDQLQGHSSIDPRWKSVKENGSPFNGNEHPAMVAIRTGQTVTDTVMGVYHPEENDYRWILISSVPEFKNGQNETYRVFTTFTDITERKKAEEQIKQNTDRLKALVKIFEYKTESLQELLDYSLNEALVLTNSKIGYIYYYNEQTEEFTLNSWTKNIMAECKIAEPKTCYELNKTGIWGEVVRQRREIVINNFNDTNPFKKGYPMGHVVLHRFMSIPIFMDSKIVAVIGVANREQDYTEADVNELKFLMNSVWGIVKRMEDNNKIMKLSAAVEQSSASVVITDIKGTIEYVNPKFSQITGYAYLEAVGNNPRVLNSGFHSKTFFKNLWDTILKGNDWKGQLINKKKNGELYWESALISPIKNGNGSIVNFIAVKEDITDLKKAELAIRESEEKLRTIFDNSRQSFLIVGLNGKVQVFNKTAANRVSSFFRKELKEGSSINEIYPLEFLKTIMPNVQRIYKGETVLKEVRILDNEGSEFWYELNLSPIFGNKRTVTSIFISTLDISERKKAEHSIFVALEKEKELNLLKSRFVSTVSHEFRTPLASIMSNVQLIDRYQNRWDEQKKANSFNRIYESIKVMTSMLDDVSLIGKEQGGMLSYKPEPLIITEFAMQIVDDAQVSLGVKNRVNITFLGDAKVVMLDKFLLRHIFINLLTNAIKYSAVNTSVEFIVNATSLELHVLVKDNGIGIPKDEIEKILEPFYRATNTEEYKGTGLGLSIVKQCVGVHNGRLNILSNINEGTTVEVFIPISIA